MRVIRWPFNPLAGSLLGAWAGASWAVQARATTLQRVLAVLLVGIAAGLVATHFGHASALGVEQPLRTVLGVAAGFGIGLVAAVIGVAGGELLIPTIVLLYGLDIKPAGSLSLAVSLPTMIVAFTRYSRDGSFVALGQDRRFVAAMAGGSIAGTVAGGLILGAVPSRALAPMLALLLLVSARRIWVHQAARQLPIHSGSPSLRRRR
jgi:uncharacterized membrane protein YfcA